ncbi:hypothetical protein HYC85_030677 [Camellia sinensis]|uniref:Wall-associated receptor kinase C-terminal domain-containing protein n=1 Tax=Camellia sinensis TaxID=4442 RepID=A0A7J7G5E8_CAMSI|nr:hypothetical protein HYC85_030677 [Camellia sinensis]
MPPLCVNLIITIFFFLVSSPTSHGAGDEFYPICLEKTYDCGEQIQGIGYPFWGEDRPSLCGVQGFKLTCKGNAKHKVPVFQEALYAFWVTSMTLEELVNRGFGVAYHDMDYFQHCVTCYASGGECGTDTTTNQAICFFQGIWS